MEDLSLDVSEQLKGMRWSFNDQADSGEQWVYDVGMGEVHYEGGSKWLEDLKVAESSCECN